MAARDQSDCRGLPGKDHEQRFVGDRTDTGGGKPRIMVTVKT